MGAQFRQAARERGRRPWVCGGAAAAAAARPPMQRPSRCGEGEGGLRGGGVGGTDWTTPTDGGVAPEGERAQRTAQPDDARGATAAHVAARRCGVRPTPPPPVGRP